MKFKDVMLPEWFGVLGSAVIAALIIALAVPAPSDDLGYGADAQLQSHSNGAPYSATGHEDKQP